MSNYGQTSLITILSSEHGRLRREQRDINKRDLQKALKYGTRTRGWGFRWMVEYDGIIFITDDSCRREVTAFPSPLALAPIDSKSVLDHVRAKEVLDQKPDLCTSHTVLVVDNSGSMTTHDIILHRDRQVAAYTTTALEFIADQLMNETANNRDVVSLIEFSNTALVVFRREPLSWILYNKLLKRRDTRDYKNRAHAKFMEVYQCDSNYLPALEEAERLLALDNHDTCALSLFFLSDGAPSDARALGLTPSAAVRRMCQRMEVISNRFPEQLNVTMVGFGNAHDDFSALESMVSAVNAAAGVEIAKFAYCEKMANAVGAAITSLVSSTTQTRVTLLDRGSRMIGRTKRQIQSEADAQSSHVFYTILDHFLYDPSLDGWVHFPGLPPGCLRENNMTEARTLQRNPPPVLALKINHCGMGAERVAFRCLLADNTHASKLGAMVAKETNLVERIEENILFHKSFCETQSLAAHLAEEFNQRIHALPHFDACVTPRISFLKCSVLVLKDPNWLGGSRGMLVEKQLDTDRFPWRKWNSNAGAVDGKHVHMPLDVDKEMEKLNKRKNNLKHEDVFTITERESDEESDEELSEEDNSDNISSYFMSQQEMANPSDYLQAFTHFTYLFTNRKLMVCDLQGVYNTDMVPPTFELSDPAIHYRSKRREMVFGRTDKGEKGIELFFRTHKCSGVCKLMQLTQKNRDWKKKWQREFSTDNQNFFVA